ncbi:MAG: methyltransferase FkbM family [Magnetococcales bacterium]|nr:methyltransferase FkbM family [Magnetococcales bacterium]HIJ83708.1 FkbM family methyltransferase [Magnetococcales bacterium]
MTVFPDSLSSESPLRAFLRSIKVKVRYFLYLIPFFPIPVCFSLPGGRAVRLYWSFLYIEFMLTKWPPLYNGRDNNEFKFLGRFLEPGMCFFDIGAHHGMYALVANKILQGHAKVVLFEPSRRERRRIHLHVLMNRARIKVESYAITQHSKPLSFFVVRSGFISMNSLRNPVSQARTEEITVQGISLDDYCSQNGIDKIDIMKVDVEGGEKDLFAGAQHCLSTLRPVIICEVLDFVAEPWGYKANQIIEYLQKFNYVWFDFSDDGTLIRHHKRDDYPEVSNYLAVPEEKIKDFAEGCMQRP